MCFTVILHSEKYHLSIIMLEIYTVPTMLLITIFSFICNLYLILYIFYIDDSFKSIYYTQIV